MSDHLLLLGLQCVAFSHCMATHPMSIVQAGLDSLGAVELRNTVASKYSINCPATLAFDYPTASALSEFVAMALPKTEDSCTAAASQPLPSELPSLLSSVNADEILGRVTRIVNGVLGIEISLSQPLMEVRALATCFHLFAIEIVLKDV